MPHLRCFNLPLAAGRGLLAIALLPLALGAPVRADEPAPPPTPARDAMGAIERAIGDAPCSDTADCRTVGVGAKSCGGPERYLAWSVRYTQAAELDPLVARHRAARRAEDVKDGRVSNCAVTPEPAVACVAKRCQLQPALPTR